MKTQISLAVATASLLFTLSGGASAQTPQTNSKQENPPLC
jgi:hypothetical protein